MSLFHPKRFLLTSTILVATILFGQNDGILIKDVNWCVSPFCKVKKHHTICMWGTLCDPERRCQTSLEFNKEMKDYVMELHNKKRNLVALGEEHKIPEAVRKASDMKVMQWDLHLEFVARCHSRQCDRNHDECRVVPRFSQVGQNIYTHNFTKEEAADVEAKDVIDKAVEAWYSEVAHVPEEMYTEWDKTEKPSDHFTQMIWANTRYMGCGLSQKEKPDKSVEYFLVCNYAPEGNKKEKTIYNVGEPCSQCSKGKSCNTQYKGLCGKITEYPLKCPCEEEQEDDNE